MSLYVTLKNLPTIEKEYADLWEEENAQFAFTNVDCGKDMLSQICEGTWYKVEYDEDGDVRPSGLWGTYPNEIIIDTMED